MDKYTITYTGKAPSLNDWYSGQNWYKRSQTKEKYGKIFAALLFEARVPAIGRFKIDISFNSRLDTDNVVGLAKILVDTMKGSIVPQDDKRFYRGLTIEPNELLPKNTYIITIIAIDGDTGANKK